MTIFNSTIAPKYRYARLATFFAFAMHGSMMYIWSTSVTAFRFQLGLAGAPGDLSYGMLVFFIGLGGSIGSLFTGMLMDKFGSKKVVRMAVLFYPLSLIPLGLATDYWFALAVGAMLGVFRGAADTAINAHGVQIERSYGRPLLSNFHACSSLGGFFIGMIGSYFANLNPQSALAPFVIIGSFLTLVSFVLSFWILNKDDALDEMEVSPKNVKDVKKSASQPLFALMFGFGLIWLTVMIGEGTVGDWGQEYFHRVLGTSAAYGGLAISFFTAGGFIGRLLGDRVIQFFGPSRVMLASGLIAIAGLVTAQLGTSQLAMGGFALFGLGLACIGPLILSAAGRRDPKNAGRNIGIVNCVAYTGMLAGPAGIALAVTNYTMGVLLLIPLSLMVLVTIFGPFMVREKKETALEKVHKGVRA